MRLGIDVGGTNTDAVILDEDDRLLAKDKTWPRARPPIPKTSLPVSSESSRGSCRTGAWIRKT